jgi:16S rRNA (cytosine1402-N4)-methyltransferase
MNEQYHIPVLLQAVLDGLAIEPDGVYVDCTFGGGGHSGELLKKLGTNGRLFAFDQDADAQRNLPKDERVVFVPQNFRHLQRFLRLHGVQEVNGMMADLGVSSHQFDEADRGFSIRFDAALDMRMNQQTGMTAAQLLNTYGEQQLHKLFEQLGEVTNSKTLAATIVQARKSQPFSTISHFKQTIGSIIKGNPNKYLAQVFQALRIEVNDELGALKEMLQQSVSLLKPGGRLAIITFHSLEDRIVKNFIRSGQFEAEVEDLNPFENTKRNFLLKAVNKKPIEATAIELKQNSRSRSAKLRVAEKLKD